MAITYPVTGVGTSGILTTSFTLTIPTVAVNDILLLGITCRDSVGDPIVTDDDTGGNTWAKIISGNNGTSLAAVYWKRATSATSAKTITVDDNAADATTSICGALLIARGVDTGATPYANGSYESNVSTNETHAGFTPGANGAGIVLCVFNATNDIEPDTFACTDPGALTAGTQYGESTGGSDCSVEFGAGVQTTANATGNLTWGQVDAASMSIVFSLTAVAASATSGLVSWSELETPNAPTAGVVSWSELEIPAAPTAGIVSWSELETPTAPTAGVVSWSELEVPGVETAGVVSWAELQVPDFATPTAGIVSWSELEVPTALTAGVVSWSELEIPTAPTAGVVSWGELEVPIAPTAGIVSWAELEAPGVLTAGLISWTELETPEVASTEAPLSLRLLIAVTPITSVNECWR